MRTALVMAGLWASAFLAGCQASSARTDSAGNARDLRWYGAHLRVGMSKPDAFTAVKKIKYPDRYGSTRVADRPTDADYPSDTWYVAFGDSVDLASLQAYVFSFQEGRLARIRKVDLGGAAAEGSAFGGERTIGGALPPDEPLNITYRRQFMQFTVPQISAGGVSSSSSTSSHTGP
jgi:hypothetical protein